MFLDKKISCSICARGGSKGIKGKNHKNIFGKPLVVWTVEQAIKSKIFDHVILSTDCEQIAKAGQAAGAEVFFKRDPQLAQDHSGKIPVIRDAFQRIEAHFKTKYPIHVDLDVTSPLRTSQDIIDAVKLFLKNDWDNLLTGMPSRRSPYFNLVEDIGGQQIKLSKETTHPIIRRQDSPICYDLNASIYIWKRDVLLKSDSVYNEKTGIFVMPEERSIDIDNEIDFAFCEFLLKRRAEE
jgi:CMP-N,N'-diacetyllegionaminic acid synthase